MATLRESWLVMAATLGVLALASGGHCQGQLAGGHTLGVVAGDGGHTHVVLALASGGHTLGVMAVMAATL